MSFSEWAPGQQQRTSSKSAGLWKRVLIPLFQWQVTARCSPSFHLDERLQTDLTRWLCAFYTPWRRECDAMSKRVTFTSADFYQMHYNSAYTRIDRTYSILVHGGMDGAVEAEKGPNSLPRAHWSPPLQLIWSLSAAWESKFNSAFIWQSHSWETAHAIIFLMCDRETYCLLVIFLIWPGSFVQLNDNCSRYRTSKDVHDGNKYMRSNLKSYRKSRFQINVSAKSNTLHCFIKFNY